MGSHPHPCCRINYNWIITIAFCSVPQQTAPFLPCSTGCFAGMFYPTFSAFLYLSSLLAQTLGPAVPVSHCRALLGTWPQQCVVTETLGFFS